MQQDARRRLPPQTLNALLHLLPAASCRGGPMHENIIKLAEVTQASTGEDKLALAFAEERAGNLRYVAAWGRWLAWDGTRWILDDTLHTFDRVRNLCREVSARASAQLVAAVERLARSDRRLAATADQWDANPWLLNTPGGVVDLHTKQTRPHCPDDYLIKITAVGPDASCSIPIWTNFLDRITGDDTELSAFIGRILGYALTGVTHEHAMFFAYGSGANGKSVLTATAAGILGDYHTSAPIETFVATSQERHPTDLAGLRGARLVTVTETEGGRRWAEAKIKTLTGGDRISARFMRQDFFEFLPQFKLWIAGNHKPHLRSVDEAIRRRFHLIPFTVTIPPSERDQKLAEKLKAEWPGILQWMIDGCQDWQSQGLAAPATVRSATDDYFESEDAVGAWIEDRCDHRLDSWELTKTLFASWKEWAETAGEHAGTRKRFVQALENRGFRCQRRHNGRGIEGLSTKP
jgi:putative DNA primase/helicase